MKQKTKRQKVRRRVSAEGFFLLCILGVLLMFPIDGIRRLVKKPDTSGNIVAEGNFVGVTEAPTEPAASGADGQPPAETQVQQANTTLPFGEGTVPDGCVSVSQDQTTLHNGRLLQLDSAHAFSGTVSGLTTFAEKNESYRIKQMELQVLPEVVEAMNQMGEAYQAATGKADLMIYSTTAPYEVQGSLYPDALPDRATGLCVDLCILNADTSISRMEETEPWVAANAWQYGFVVSYPAEDADATGVTAPYHLRFVGRVHAGIMHREGLTLNAYETVLKLHTIETPLTYRDGAEDYTVYYVPAETGVADVPVPLDVEYSISGNNVDGFIVEVKGTLS